ncbi:betaine-aldehyde dehydrogenase [Sneathiella limimaris]|uniref:betaine-aldehyde dehydrogenase n=1 Tax=Sneathiella limimaris TaxID=1964213 RepID=UPI00146AAB9B|nr:betaine-aldehyde dehydrogenase [Sneathiella limimaris]
MAISTLPLFIGGKAVFSSSGETFTNYRPMDGAVDREISLAGPDDVELAISVAQNAQEEWATVPGIERGRILLAAARIMRDRRQEIAEIETLDTGKPISETPYADVDSAIDALEFFGGIAMDMKGDFHDLGNGSMAYSIREPLGVCAGIGAWNYPLQIATWKSAPALAAGNAMIFKPSELTPLNAYTLAEIYREAGLPDGLFNVVQGMGQVGAILASHPGIDKLTFTGSVPTGKRVLEAAASTVKHTTMELGGKSPLIIFEDADLDNAVAAAMNANFYSQGEVCSNGTRVFVHASIRDMFLEKLVERTEKMVIGDPMAEETHVGALISEDHGEKVLSYVELGVQQGATLITGGERVEVPDMEGGFYMSPAVFAGCEDHMRICQEEIFGPVMSVLTFQDEKEVIKRANNTEFGLAAGLFTKDLARAHRVVRKLQAGSCWVNNYNLTPAGVPFGGSKQSGIGRENCARTLDHFSEIKSVYVELGDVESSY